MLHVNICIYIYVNTISLYSFFLNCDYCITILNYLPKITDNIIIIIIIYFIAVLFYATKHDPKRPKYKEPISIDYRERKSHARGVYLIQYTSLMGTAKVKEEEETDTWGLVKYERYIYSVPGVLNRE